MPCQPKSSDLFQAEPRLRELVRLVRSRLGAEEVWLFGSRGRGDHRPGSDWDVLAVLPDAAGAEADDPVTAWRIGRDAGLPADVLIARRGEFEEADKALNTLAAVARREGVRLDV